MKKLIYLSIFLLSRIYIYSQDSAGFYKNEFRLHILPLATNEMDLSYEVKYRNSASVFTIGFIDKNVISEQKSGFHLQYEQRLYLSNGYGKKHDRSPSQFYFSPALFFKTKSITEDKIFCKVNQTGFKIMFGLKQFMNDRMLIDINIGGVYVQSEVVENKNNYTTGFGALPIEFTGVLPAISISIGFGF